MAHIILWMADRPRSPIHHHRHHHHHRHSPSPSPSPSSSSSSSPGGAHNVAHIARILSAPIMMRCRSRAIADKSTAKILFSSALRSKVVQLLIAINISSPHDDDSWNRKKTKRVCKYFTFNSLSTKSLQS